MRATERALPWPLARPGSPQRARPSCRKPQPARRSTGGLPSFAPIDPGSGSSPQPSSGGGTNSPTRASSLAVQTDVEVRAEALRHLFPEKGTEALAAHPPDELAEQVAMGHGLVSAAGARLPPGRLGGEQPGAFVPVVERFQGDRRFESRQPGHVAEQITHGQLLFAGLGELRPVLRHGGIRIDRTPVDEDQGRDGRHHLGGRVDIDDGVPLPGPGPRRIGMSRPDVHDELPVHGRRKGRTDLPALPEVVGERIPDGDETRVAVPCHLDRCGHALSACAWPGRPRTRSPSSRQRSADALRTCRPCRTPRVRGRPRARS